MAIQISRLVFAYGSRFAMRIEDLTFCDDRLHVVIGPNASGKTTLARIVSGLIGGYSGSVTVGGVDIRNLSTKARSKLIAYTHRSMVVNLNVTLERFVGFGRYAHTQGVFGFLSKQDRLKVAEAMELVDLGDKSQALLSELSDGELQRALLAKVIAQQAAYTILDEPTSNLDLKHRKEILHLLERLKRKSTFIVILHDINEALRIFESLIALKDGAVEFVWDTPDAFSLQKLSQLFTINLKMCRNREGMFITY